MSETDARHRRRRRTKIAFGAALLATGVTGLAFTLAAPATAGADGDGDGGSHDVMHQMMDAMHGDGTSQRMHAIDGAEEMMDDCAGMMDEMSSMDPMMGGAGMMGA